MYDTLSRHLAIKRIVTRETPRGQLMKYYRFRADRWYGGVATADVVGCGLLCKFCWVSENILERPESSGQFFESKEATLRILRVATNRHLVQLRLSGGEPTIGRSHLLGVLTEIEKQRRFRFVLETNGILLGADSTYCDELAAFRCVHIRVSLKGSSEREFENLTGAKGEGFKMQLDSLSNLRDAGASYHPAVMSSFSSQGDLCRLRERISRIEQRLVGDLELEELIRYPRVEQRLQRFHLKPIVSHDPRHVPERLI